jgi:NIMA (never in mitosis gene a)-related kinase
MKPANIFFGKNNVPKIGDMNVSIFMNKDLAYTQTGTPYYASPEVWNNDPYSYECDIWSFGCMLYEMCTFKPPFKGKNMDALYEKIQRCQYEKISKRYSP